MLDTSLVPITLLTGFLGAGKSTALNRFLSNDPSARVMIIVNEFGDVGLDHDLIESADEQVVLLPSGCICCSIRNDLRETITELLDKRSLKKIDFDRILIESTGLADPVPIQQTFVVDEFLASQTYLDGVVTIADTLNGPKTLSDHFEAVSQVATADLILMSKTDLATKEQIENFKRELIAINPTAEICTVSEVGETPDLLWGRSGFRKNASEQNLLSWVTPSQKQNTNTDPFANLSGFEDIQNQNDIFAHDATIVSASFEVETPLADRVFDKWLDTLIMLRGSDILRVKGIIFLEDIPHPFAFHGVQHIFSPPMPLKDWSKPGTTSRIVVIAKNLSEIELQRSFDMLRATPIDDEKISIFKEFDKDS